jgi:hypothetical protein
MNAVVFNMTSGEAGEHQRRAYDAAHALPRYSTTVEHTSAEERQITRNLLAHSFAESSLEFLIATHRYGDTFWHSYEKNGVEVPYNRGIFNTGHNAPNALSLDRINDVDAAERGSRLEGYALTLYDVLTRKGSNEPRLTREQLGEVIDRFKQTERGKKDSAQSAYLSDQIQDLFFLDAQSFKRASLDEQLQQVEARELILEALRLPENAVSTEEFRQKFPQLSQLLGDISPGRVDEALKQVEAEVRSQRSWTAPSTSK